MKKTQTLPSGSVWASGGIKPVRRASRGGAASQTMTEEWSYDYFSYRLFIWAVYKIYSYISEVLIYRKSYIFDSFLKKNIFLNY